MDRSSCEIMGRDEVVRESEVNNVVKFKLDSVARPVLGRIWKPRAERKIPPTRRCVVNA